MAAKLGSGSDDKVVPINPNAEVRREQEAALASSTFLDAVREIARINGEVRSLNERRKSVRKKWKAEGVELGILDATIKMAEWDRSEVRAHFDNARRYAEWLGLPVGSQKDLFSGMGEDEVQQKEWRALGRVASRLGKPARAPEECPAEYQQHYMQGFHEADEEEWDEAERTEAQRQEALRAAEKIDPDKKGNLADVAKALDAKPAKKKGVSNLKAASFDDSKAGKVTHGDLPPKPGALADPDAVDSDDEAKSLH